MFPSPNTQKCIAFAIAALLVTCAANARSDGESGTRVEKGEPDTEEARHTIILGVGGAAELELGDGSLHPGPNAFVEYEAIENWLELELGVSVLAAEGGREVPVDLLFKKPFQLTSRLELMIGLGPQIVSVSGTEKNGTFIGGEIVFDFMFWPLHHFGFWVEPSYGFLFRGGVSHGLSTTGGVIFGW